MEKTYIVHKGKRIISTGHFNTNNIDMKKNLESQKSIKKGIEVLYLKYMPLPKINKYEIINGFLHKIDASHFINKDNIQKRETNIENKVVDDIVLNEETINRLLILKQLFISDIQKKMMFQFTNIDGQYIWKELNSNLLSKYIKSFGENMCTEYDKNFKDDI